MRKHTFYKKFRKLFTKPIRFFKDIGEYELSLKYRILELESILKNNNIKINKNSNCIIDKEIKQDNIIDVYKQNNIITISKTFIDLFKNKYNSIFINFNTLNNKYFNGFKNSNNLYIKENYCDFNPNDNLYKIFRMSPDLRGNYFKNVSNIFVFNPKNYLPILIYNSNPFINLIVIIDENNKETFDFLNKYKNKIGTLIIGSNNRQYYSNIINEYYFNNYYEYDGNEETKINIINNVIIANSKKEKNMLFPILYKKNIPLENIDYFNNNKYIDGVIKITYNNSKKITNFNDIIGNIENIELFLLKEEFFVKYKKLLYLKKYKLILERSIKDGARYEII